MDELLTVEELAKAAKVPVQTVYVWNSQGTGPRSIKVGKYVRYRLRDVEAGLDAKSREVA